MRLSKNLDHSKMKIALIFSLFLFTRATQAFETLNYDCSVWRLPDVGQALNIETNKRIERSLQWQNGCDEKSLLRALHSQLAQPWTNNLETWADHAPLPRCKVPASKSVYQDFTLIESPIGILAGLKSVINIGGVYVGTDKLSHFMTEGFQYFANVRRGATVEQVLNQGLREENGIYGMITTGIRSYADLSANYFGFRFWSELLGGETPLIACENGKWSQKRPFEWQQYINDSFDESVNCNEFKTSAMEAKVDQRTKELLRKANRGGPLTCPLKPESCVELTRKMPAQLSEFLISKRCRGSQKD